MEKIINTALQYISVFFNTDAVLFHKDSYDFKLPNPYSSEKENQIVCQLFDSTQDSVFYLNDRLSVSYCLAFLQQNAILVGPYRTGAFTVPIFLFRFFPLNRSGRFFSNTTLLFQKFPWRQSNVLSVSYFSVFMVTKTSFTKRKLISANIYGEKFLLFHPIRICTILMNRIIQKKTSITSLRYAAVIIRLPLLHICR